MEEQQPKERKFRGPRRNGPKKTAAEGRTGTGEIDKEPSNPGVAEKPVAISSKLKPPNTFTCVICTENSDFYAVGVCDHPICSICALRMRLVAKDKDCVMCKQRMDFMIVSMFRQRLQPFQSFGVFADTVAPGVRIDHLSSLYFVNCAKHDKDLDAQRAVSCSLCRERFRHRKDLSKHLSTVHDLAMCQLCLDNLRLFVCEQQLYTKNELKIHMNGKPGGALGAHPQCQFCKTNLFDSMQLYAHMRDRHFSCYLCPSAHQHRFYKNIGDLELHFKNSHITCSICFSQSPVGARSFCVFKSNQEYRDHMLAEHNISLPPNSTNHLKVAFKFSNKSSSTASSGRGADEFGEQDFVEDGEPAFLDLFVEETRREDRAASARSAPKRQRGRASGALAGATTDSQLLQLVPDHMKVAGRVTGTGLFTRDASDDLFEQHSREVQQSAQRTGYAARVSANASGVRYNSMYDFPTLAAEGGGSMGSAAVGSAGQPLHPLSLVAQIGSKAATGKHLSAAAATAPATATAPVTAAPSKRSDAFAQALGIDPTHHSAPQSHMQNVAQEAVALPLFPPSLLSWAVQNKAVLLKTEKRISTFMEDKSSASLQLPPMQRPIREGVHGLAMYYGLTSHEFDHEPKRYVSLVKGPTSRTPPCLLSTAAQRPWVSVASVLKSGSFLPGVYISLQETPKAPVFVSTIVHKVDAMLSELCAAEFNGSGEHSSYAFSNAMKILRPVKVGQFNASTVLLEYSSVAVASRIHSTLAANVAQLGDTFLIIPGFANSGQDMHRSISSNATLSTVGAEECARLSAWDDEVSGCGPGSSDIGGQSRREGTDDQIDFGEIDVEIDEKLVVDTLAKAFTGDGCSSDEDEWETVNAKDLLISKASAVDKKAPEGPPKSTHAAFVPFPKGSITGSNEHFVATVAEDPAVIAKREEEWVKFLDDHKRKPRDAGSAEVAAYQPPSRRPQAADAGSTTQYPAHQSSVAGRAAPNAGPSQSYASSSKKATQSSYPKGAAVKKTVDKPQSSFAMLQLEDSESSDEDDV